MVLTTTTNIEGFKIIDYLGIVSGIAVNENKLALGFSMKKYYAEVHKSVEETKEAAFQNLHENATKLKANAVVGIKVDIELTSTNYSIVSVTGTAVKVAV